MPRGKGSSPVFTWEVERVQWGRGHTVDKQAVPGGFPYHLLISWDSSEEPKGSISELLCWGEQPLAVPIPAECSMVITSLMLLDYTQVKLKWFSVGTHTTSAESVWCDLIQFSWVALRTRCFQSGVRGNDWSSWR